VLGFTKQPFAQFGENFKFFVRLKSKLYPVEINTSEIYSKPGEEIGNWKRVFRREAFKPVVDSVFCEWQVDRYYAFVELLLKAINCLKPESYQFNLILLTLLNAPRTSESNDGLAILFFGPAIE
jgi:hypothetical protein